MEPILLSVLLLGALELFEAWWQRSETLFGVLERGFGYYQKSIFLFFLMHPAFYFIFFVVLATGKAQWLDRRYFAFENSGHFLQDCFDEVDIFGEEDRCRSRGCALCEA